MKRFYLAYADETIWRQVVAKLPQGEQGCGVGIWPQAVAKLDGKEAAPDFLNSLFKNWHQALLPVTIRQFSRKLREN